jgi:hypothetical protein
MYSIAGIIKNGRNINEILASESKEKKIPKAIIKKYPSPLLEMKKHILGQQNKMISITGP